MNDAISRSALEKVVRQSFEDAGLHYADWQKFMRWLRKAPALDVAPDLNTLRDAIYEDAVAHGLWDRVTTNPYKLRTYSADLLHEEVCELEEAYENVQEYIEELADVIIMSLSVAGKLGIDIDAAVRRKMEINKKRPWRHENEGGN